MFASVYPYNSNSIHFHHAEKGEASKCCAQKGTDERIDENVYLSYMIAGVTHVRMLLIHMATVTKQERV